MAVHYDSRAAFAKMVTVAKQDYIQPFDANKDGGLTRGEASKVLKSGTPYASEHLDGDFLVLTKTIPQTKQGVDEAAFKAADANADGKLTAEELASGYYRAEVNPKGDGDVGFFARIFKEDNGSFKSWLGEKLFPKSFVDAKSEERVKLSPTEKMLYERNMELQRQQDADGARRRRELGQDAVEVGVDIGGEILKGFFG